MSGKSSRNGSEPTAVFHKDSLYRELHTLSEVLALVSSAKQASKLERKVTAVVNVSVKTFETSPYDWMNFTGRIECLGKLPESTKAKVFQLFQLFQNLEADLKAL